MKISGFKELKSTTKPSARLPQWFIWRPYCFIIHSYTTSPTNGLRVRRTVRTTHWLMRLFLCRSWGVTTKCVFFQQSIWVSGEHSWWHVCKWTGVKVKEWAETAVFRRSELGDEHRQITCVEEGTDADCRNKDVTLLVSLPQHLCPCVCYVPC